MYYAALPAGGAASPGVQGLDKVTHHPQQTMYLASPFQPGAAGTPAAYAANPGAALPPGLRYAPQAPAYTVVSQAGGYPPTLAQPTPAFAHHHPAFQQAAALQGMTPSAPAYISQAAAQAYPGTIGYPANLAPRPTTSPYQYQATGTPLIAATGYPAAHAAQLAAHHAALQAQTHATHATHMSAQPQLARHYQMAAAYPGGYTLPAGATATLPMPYPGAAFGPPF